MFHGSAPVLFVKDLSRSLDFYCDVLGFERPNLWGDPPAFAMPKREGMIVMLSQQSDAAKILPKGEIWDVYFWVRDAKALFESINKKGITIHQEPIHKEHYGNLEFIIQDPDGYLLAFGQELTENAFFDFQPSNGLGDTKMLHMCPVLASQDVEKDIAWYEDKLGFKNVYDSSDYGEVPINYAVLRRQNLFLHLQFQYPKDMTRTDVRIEVNNIVPLLEEYKAKGLIPADMVLSKTPWNTIEFGLFDLNKNRITFLEDV